MDELDLDQKVIAGRRTPLPWHYWIEDAFRLSEIPWGFRDSSGRRVFGRQGPPDDKDAVYLQHAINRFDALVAELRAARAVIKAADSYRAWLPLEVVERLDDYDNLTAVEVNVVGALHADGDHETAHQHTGETGDA